MGNDSREGGLTDFVVFLDENHCRNPHLLRVFEQSNVRCEKHLDHFPAGLLVSSGSPSSLNGTGFLLTTDARIRSKPRVNELERRAVARSGLRMFYFSTNQASGEQMGDTLRRALPRMRALCAEQMPPFTASINKAGEVTLRDDAASCKTIGYRIRLAAKRNSATSPAVAPSPG